MSTNGQQLKQRIIETARDRFFAIGFSKVTMDELASDLGISKKTMYQSFRSKDDLVDAAVEWHLISLGSRLHEIVDSSDDFIEKLYRLWTQVGEAVSRVRKQFQNDVRRFRPDLWKRIDGMRTHYIQTYVNQLFDEGIRIGVIREAIDKDLLMLAFLGAVQGVINPEVLAHHSFSAEDAFLTIRQIVFEGILTDEARSHMRKRIPSRPSPPRKP